MSELITDPNRLISHYQILPKITITKAIKSDKKPPELKLSLKKINSEEMIYSDSEDSSFSEEIFNDVIQIRNITKNLTEGLKERLINYKQIKNTYSKQEEEIRNKLIAMKEETGPKKVLNDLRVETTEANEKIAQIKEFISSKNSRIPTEDAQIYYYSECDENLSENLLRLQAEINSIKQMCTSNGIVPENHSSKSINDPKDSVLENESKISNCSCGIF